MNIFIGQGRQIPDMHTFYSMYNVSSSYIEIKALSTNTKLFVTFVQYKKEANF